MTEEQVRVYWWTITLILVINLNDNGQVSAFPHPPNKLDRKERQFQKPLFEMERNPDGSISGAFSMANAMSIPGVADSSFAMANSFTIGKDGMSFANSQSSSMDAGDGPFKTGFSQSSANAVAAGGGPGGFGSSNANANAVSVDSPFFKSSFVNANANSNSFSTPDFNGPPNGGPPFRRGPHRPGPELLFR